MSEVSFHIGPIRPPSEADSLLFQITNGCTWNKCKFCQLYKHTKFKAYSADILKHDIDNMVILAQRILRHIHHGSWDIQSLNEELGAIRNGNEQQCYYMMANWLIRGGEHVFLQDGNSIALRDGRLSDVLRYLKECFPSINRITTYGRAENLSRLSADEYAELKDAGLDRIHSGFETGSDQVLQFINKGVTQAQELTAGRNIKAGGIELSIYFMPGVGGKALSDENARETAFVLNEINPDYFRIRTFAQKEGTPLYEDWRNGTFIPCTDEEKLLEIRKVIELAEGVSTTIVSDHILNLLQKVEGKIVDDKGYLLGIIDQFLNLSAKDKREYQLARRMGMVLEPADMNRLRPERIGHVRNTIASIPEAEWETNLTMLMKRYI